MSEVLVWLLLVFLFTVQWLSGPCACVCRAITLRMSQYAAHDRIQLGNLLETEAAAILQISDGDLAVELEDL